MVYVIIVLVEQSVQPKWEKRNSFRVLIGFVTWLKMLRPKFLSAPWPGLTTPWNCKYQVESWAEIAYQETFLSKFLQM